MNGSRTRDTSAYKFDHQERAGPKPSSLFIPPTPLPPSSMGAVDHGDDGIKARRSDVQLGAAPVPALCVVL